MSSNVAHLRRYDEQLFRLGSLAERYFREDPNTALLKLRQLGELLAQQVASRFGVQPPRTCCRLACSSWNQTDHVVNGS